ncbi:MAG: 6-phosphogluconolactonase [Thermomicrobiales bacterium]
MSQAEIHVSPDAAALAVEAARRFVLAASAAIAARGRFVVALSGGSTPKALFQLLATAPYREEIDWSRVDIAWGDERCVPPDDDQSNYKMAHDTLLAQVPILAARIHRIPAENPDHEAAAATYALTLRQLFDLAPGVWPRFDLIHLGLGPEGHTASLFPGSPALHEQTRLVAAPFVEKLNAYRSTLTPPVLNAAREVQFLVAGSEKAAIVREILHAPHNPDELPAQIVAPAEGQLVWLLDSTAAAQL